MKRTRNHLNYIYPILILTTSGIGISAITNNFSAGVYTTNQDSIGMPIGAIIFVCLTLITMHFLQLPHYTKIKTSHSVGAILKTLSVISGAVSFILLAGSINYWYAPNHMTIALFYGLTAIVYVALQIQLFKKLN